jgi:hypothetical protein
MIAFAGNLSGSFSLNDPEFPDSSMWQGFSLLNNIPEVFVAGGDVFLEKVGHPQSGKTAISIRASDPAVFILKDNSGNRILNLIGYR